MNKLYPPIQPFNTFRFKVSEIHELYVEEIGNLQGQPVVFLHGGPGGGLAEKHRQYFNPEKYRVILFDQRGAGKSTPHACLEENTTWDLVSDIEKIREHLNIEKWLVFGGSWGSTLALAYAETHPERVSGLILRGIFLCRKSEIDWFYQEGCSWIYPDLWEKYIAPVPEDKRGKMVEAYYELLTSDDEHTRLAAARAWSTWEGATIKLIPDLNLIENFDDPGMALSLARIECHYFINNCFLRSDNQLLEDIYKIRHIPTIIVHGRYDVVCPTKNAWDLHKAFPEAKLHIIQDAGHAVDEPGIINALIEATDGFRI
ncbi:MAG: prolyl aminopeptidase [Candidatus Caenarcaniphilales bacterium]|nr:prolyl aminopeptidase [Candidatus Caenarcaniphilales bacterium]